jgi:hypothetical protein
MRAAGGQTRRSGSNDDAARLHDIVVVEDEPKPFEPSQRAEFDEYQILDNPSLKPAAILNEILEWNRPR